ncbi:MAG: hypothetical protein ORN28_08705 [Rhodoferax sp.]|nr:hypothetical protein [Rhodoferax sp.]
MKSESKSRKQLQVILGSQTIKAFVAAPKEFKVLGIVRLGSQTGRCVEFGLLATTESGEYVRVNGSTVSALNRRAVETAMLEAQIKGRGESYAASRSHEGPPKTTPTVIVRKRRRLSDIRPALLQANLSSAGNIPQAQQTFA